MSGISGAVFPSMNLYLFYLLTCESIKTLIHKVLEWFQKDVQALQDHISWVKTNSGISPNKFGGSEGGEHVQIKELQNCGFGGPPILKNQAQRL